MPESLPLGLVLPFRPLKLDVFLPSSSCSSSASATELAHLDKASSPKSLVISMKVIQAQPFASMIALWGPHRPWWAYIFSPTNLAFSSRDPR